MHSSLHLSINPSIEKRDTPWTECGTIHFWHMHLLFVLHDALCAHSLFKVILYLIPLNEHNFKCFCLVRTVTGACGYFVSINHRLSAGYWWQTVELRVCVCWCLAAVCCHQCDSSVSAGDSWAGLDAVTCPCQATRRPGNTPRHCQLLLPLSLTRSLSRSVHSQYSVLLTCTNYTHFPEGALWPSLSTLACPCFCQVLAVPCHPVFTISLRFGSEPLSWSSEQSLPTLPALYPNIHQPA